MTINELKTLALHSVKGTTPSTEYSVENVDAAFADGLRELAGSVNQFMKNRYDIYEIIIEAIDTVQPKNVMSAIGMFAEVQQVAQGQKAVFKQKIGTQRAKKFFTQVGLSGVYETFRLDNKNVELAAHAVGGGATVDFERLLDGAESLQEMSTIISDALTNSVYVEVSRALVAAFNASDRPAANKYTENKFNASEMVKLMNVVRAYGNGVVIFACPEFVADMGADAIVPVGTNYQGIYSPDDIEAIHRTGYINLFRGAPIVQIPQSFVDENNNKTYMNPQYAYILPTGGEKVVKVVLEGSTQMYDNVNRDQSIEIMAYKKLGVGILCNYNWAIYQNTNLTDTSADVYGF